MTVDEPVLTIAGLHVAHPGTPEPVHAVRGIDLTVGRGEVVGIVGESGSGKSSICAALAGLLGPSARVEADRLEVDGRDLLALDEPGWQKVRGSVVATIPQQPMTAFVPLVPVGRQLTWYLGPDAIERHHDTLISLGLEVVVERPDALPGQFSGGQLQRLVIAAVTLAAEPVLLLADEPTSTLDTVTSAAVLDVLDHRRRRLGSSMILVSHDLGVVAERCDRVAVMSAGRLVEVRPVQDLFADPHHPHSRALIAAMGPTSRPGPISAAPARDAAGSAAIDAPGPWTETPAEGTATGGDRGPSTSEDGELPVLEVDRLYRYHGPSEARTRRSRRTAGPAPAVVKAVDEVSFAVPRGSITAIVGQSGSGKTTTARVVAGSLAATAGTVRLDGREVGTERTLADRRAIQLVGQNHRSALNPRRTVSHALAQAQRVHGLGANRRERDRTSVEMLERLHLDGGVMGRRPSALSGGEVARVVVARSLLLSPRLLILDEPTASLDTTIKASMLDLLAEVHDTFDGAMLVITHELAVARRLADRVVVMFEGRVVESGPVAQVLSDPHHHHTRALLAAEPSLDRRADRGAPPEDPSPT